jgi:serine/threonine-protein kinase
MSVKTNLINSSIGEYRVVDFLGAGGMGEVYRAVHTKIGRVAAVKVLIPAELDKVATDRFFNEARIQASLQHPNIATLYDFCELNGQHCIIMEYIDGQTLAECVRPNGYLPATETLRVFQSIVEAVNHIHKFGIIHRDIKSNNIKISASGQVKVLDFGIAKSPTSPSITRTGGLIGTLAYLSPEQIMRGEVDARTDIWALGVLLYEMATGHLPFEAENLGELCEKIKNAAYLPPQRFNPSVPSNVSAIISRCLKKNPADRYQSAQVLLQDVAHLINTDTAPGKRGLFPHGVSSLRTKTLLTRESAAASSAKKTKTKLAVLAAAVVILGLMVWGIYAAMSGDSVESALSPQARIVKIDVSGGNADVYRNGQKIGETPLDLSARLGEHINLTLKREGFADKDLDFTVTAQTKGFAPPMQRLGRTNVP